MNVTSKPQLHLMQQTSLPHTSHHTRYYVCYTSRHRPPPSHPTHQPESLQILGGDLVRGDLRFDGNVLGFVLDRFGLETELLCLVLHLVTSFFGLVGSPLHYSRTR